jgi:hypothetical protein
MESSPLWAIALLAILFGPVIWALTEGIRHRDSGAPRNDDASDAQAYVQIAKDLRDVQNGVKGW